MPTKKTKKKADTAAALDAELARRNLVPLPTIDYKTECHAKQASLVETIVLRKARYVAVLAGRQSGKSHGAVMASLILAANTPDIAIIYVTSTDASVRKMAFAPARKLNTAHNLNGKPNLADRSIQFPNESIVYFIGADTERTIERLRGTPNLALCVIDECGIYESDTLHKMIEAVTPGLRPKAGTLALLGTPSLQGPQGKFYEATVNTSFEQHRFTYSDNDRVESFNEVETLIDEELEALGYDRNSAYFRREYLAEFVVELSERVYQLSGVNLYEGEPPTDLDVFVTGGDLGMSANDALVTIGWNKRDPSTVWVVHEQTAAGQDSIAFAAMAQTVNDRFHPVKMVIDPGGLGQKTIKTAKSIYPGLPIVDAYKPPVVLQVRSVNMLAQSGRLRVKRGSKLALELVRPTWKDGIVGSEIDEHGKHSDLIPALRYAVLAATPYLPQLKAPEPQLSPEQLTQAKERAELAKSWARPKPSGISDPLSEVLGPRRQPGDPDWR